MNGLAGGALSVTVNGNIAPYVRDDHSATIVKKDAGDGVDIVVRSAIGDASLSEARSPSLQARI